ncbi:hypothetical protein ACHQM5_006732 [Ranunculus cassubicifolius]
MGWIWREGKDAEKGWVNFWDWEEPTFPFRQEGPLKKTIKTQSKIEEVEPGKFIRKCHNVMELTKTSVIRGTTQVVETKTYDTEDDVTAHGYRGRRDCPLN